VLRGRDTNFRARAWDAENEWHFRSERDDKLPGPGAGFLGKQPVWATHPDNNPHLRQRLMPPTDQAVAALLADLAQYGSIPDTIPRFNTKSIFHKDLRWR
jgi:hypothetical protein